MAPASTFQRPKVQLFFQTSSLQTHFLNSKQFGLVDKVFSNITATLFALVGASILAISPGHVQYVPVVGSVGLLAHHAFVYVSRKPIRILFATSGDEEEPWLRLQNETRTCWDALNRGRYHDRFKFISLPSCRIFDLVQQMREHLPALVQISAHGCPEGMHLADANGQDLLYIFRRACLNGLKVIVLNACHSSLQAEQLARIVGCAIGISDRVTDETSISFTKIFYRALADGSTVYEACEDAANSIGLDFEAVPVTAIPQA